MTPDAPASDHPWRSISAWSPSWMAWGASLWKAWSYLWGRWPDDWQRLARWGVRHGAPPSFWRHIGPPPDRPCLGAWKYHPPLWWDLACFGNASALQWCALHNIIPRTDLAPFLLGCVTHGNAQALSWALSHGADPNTSVASGHTLLWHAMHLERPDLADLLLDAGASWYHVGRNGASVAQHAQFRTDWAVWWDRRQLCDAVSTAPVQPPTRRM